ncbi:uncharacterized protein LOC129216775 [Uloborus diversus]|uniref:uncharacterized protein LOC129216775 n=1 Tax=Uloborus diversus TaxID=327109 RepID=UPI0024090322|nr:uncharacterized protein LOC129216775 [Uloborus diversus]
MSKKAHGFITDAKKLVGAFVAKNNSDFTVFADVWKKQNFSMVFLGRPNEKELLEFSRRILQITMELFYDSKADETKVGYLFLLYGLVRYQPINPPIKARVTLEHWEHIEKLRDDAEAKKNTSVLFVIRYLIRSGFDFVATPNTGNFSFYY